MKILLDHNLDWRLSNDLFGHEVSTALEMAWDTAQHLKRHLRLTLKLKTGPVSRGFGRGVAVSITRRKFGYLALNCDTGLADTGSMKQRRENNRDMCAELLTVRWTDADGRTRSEAATLEDISATGACLQLEHSILPETQVSLHYPKGKYQGKVKYCTYQDMGYLLGMAFDDGYRWSKSDFEPSHLLELPVQKS